MKTEAISKAEIRELVVSIITPEKVRFTQWHPSYIGLVIADEDEVEQVRGAIHKKWDHLPIDSRVKGQLVICHEPQEYIDNARRALERVVEMDLSRMPDEEIVKHWEGLTGQRRRIRVLYIVASEKRVKELKLPHGVGYRTIADLIGEGCHTLEAVYHDDGNVLYADEEGLYHEKKGHFKIHGFHITGDAVILGIDDEGEWTDATLSLEELISSIEFTDKKPSPMPAFTVTIPGASRARYNEDEPR